MTDRDLELLHRYRLEHGIYPEHMLPVVKELLDEIVRVRHQRDEIDRTFYAWRHAHTEAGIDHSGPAA